MRPTSRLSIALLAMLLATVGTAAAAEDSEWTGEVGLLAGTHDNFFYRGEGSPAPASDLVSLYADAERSVDTGAGEWTFVASATAVAVLDIDDADYEGFNLGAQYKQGPWKASLEGGQILNRLFSESGEAVFFDQTDLDLWLRYSINSRVWVRLRIELQDWDFDPQENDRDSDVTRLSATARYALSDRLGLRVAYLSEDRDAVGPDNNRSGSGAELALEGQPSEIVTWFLRLRTRDRDYEDAAPGDSNFRRSDTIDTLTFNVHWLLTDRLGIAVRDSYRSGDSTRPDRNFEGNVIEVGAFYRFGGRSD